MSSPTRRSPWERRRYGVLVLVVEVMGGLAMLPYGLCLTMRVTNGAPPPPDDKGQVRAPSQAQRRHGREVQPWRLAAVESRGWPGVDSWAPVLSAECGGPAALRLAGSASAAWLASCSHCLACLHLVAPRRCARRCRTTSG